MIADLNATDGTVATPLEWCRWYQEFPARKPNRCPVCQDKFLKEKP